MEHGTVFLILPVKGILTSVVYILLDFHKVDQDSQELSSCNNTW